MTTTPRHYFKELRLQQFRSLVALARWQTFSAAAAALHITRASVWQQVRSLEQEFACTLLRTRAQRVELTPAGHRLVEIAAPLVSGFDSAKTALHAAIGNELPQTLAIGASPSFLLHELREPIARIRTVYPKLHISIFERTSASAVELLEQGGVDLAIAAKPSHITARPTLEYTQLASYPFTLICRPNHPLLRRRKPSLRDLTHYPLILPSPLTYCRQQFDATVGKAGLLDKVNIVIESNFPVMLFEYVRLGLGVALTSVPPDIASLPPWRENEVVLLSLAHLFGEEPIFYVRRKGDFETPYAQCFRELVANKTPAVTPARPRARGQVEIPSSPRAS